MLGNALCAARRNRLKALMAKADLDALLIVSPANRYYLSGFELHDPQMGESAGRLIIMTNGRDMLCTDSRYKDAAKRLWSEEDILIYGQNSASDIADFLVATAGKKTLRVGFESCLLSVHFYQQLFSREDLQLVIADGLVEKLRLIKDDEEIERIDASCRLNRQTMEWLPSILRPDLSEADIAWEIEKFYREHGAEGIAFAPIVAWGENAALPHAIPSRNVRTAQNGMLLVDIGCRLNDYCSDMTRTFWLGDKPSARFQETLKIVQEAQAKAIEKIRPGVIASDLYATAKDFFAQYNLAEAFTHGLGHGVGLETHEWIALNSKNTTRLEPRMVVTVEPGIYDPTWGGIRWEDMVLVTETGHRILGSTPLQSV